MTGTWAAAFGAACLGTVCAILADFFPITDRERRGGPYPLGFKVLTALAALGFMVAAAIALAGALS